MLDAKAMGLSIIQKMARLCSKGATIKDLDGLSGHSRRS